MFAEPERSQREIDGAARRQGEGGDRGAGWQRRNWRQQQEEKKREEK